LVGNHYTIVDDDETIELRDQEAEAISLRWIGNLGEKVRVSFPTDFSGCSIITFLETPTAN
jgi:hypothetical protein